jgi:hypothetical protein
VFSGISAYEDVVVVLLPVLKCIMDDLYFHLVWLVTSV